MNRNFYSLCIYAIVNVDSIVILPIPGDSAKELELLDGIIPKLDSLELEFELLDSLELDSLELE